MHDSFPWYYVVGGVVVACVWLFSFFAVAFLLGHMIWNILF